MSWRARFQTAPRPHPLISMLHAGPWCIGVSRAAMCSPYPPRSSHKDTTISNKSLGAILANALRVLHPATECQSHLPFTSSPDMPKQKPLSQAEKLVAFCLLTESRPTCQCMQAFNSLHLPTYCCHALSLHSIHASCGSIPLLHRGRICPGSQEFQPVHRHWLSAKTFCARPCSESGRGCWFRHRRGLKTLFQCVHQGMDLVFSVVRMQDDSQALRPSWNCGRADGQNIKPVSETSSNGNARCVAWNDEPLNGGVALQDTLRWQISKSFLEDLYEPPHMFLALRGFSTHEGICTPNGRERMQWQGCGIHQWPCIVQEVLTQHPGANNSSPMNTKSLAKGVHPAEDAACKTEFRHQAPPLFAIDTGAVSFVNYD